MTTKRKKIRKLKKIERGVMMTFNFPEDVAEILKTIAKGKRTKYLVSLVRADKQKVEIESQLEIEREAEEPKPEWTEEMKTIREERRTQINRHRKSLEDLEERWFEWRFGDSGYIGEEEEYEKAKSTFPPEAVAYLDKILNLPTQQRRVVLEYIKEKWEKARQQRLWLKYGGDPDEVIWREMTRAFLLNPFERDKTYSVADVAGELGITYNQAYNHIVPWLKAQGIRVG